MARIFSVADRVKKFAAWPAIVAARVRWFCPAWSRVSDLFMQDRADFAISDARRCERRIVFKCRRRRLSFSHDCNAAEIINYAWSHRASPIGAYRFPINGSPYKGITRENWFGDAIACLHIDSIERYIAGRHSCMIIMIIMNNKR